MRAFVLALFSIAGLLLAGTGIFAIVSQNVNLRMREIGIRLALGASANSIRGVVVRRTAMACGAGLLVGCGASVAAARWLAEMLYGVETASPATFGTATGAVVVCIWLATAPALRRALKVDPATIIRLNDGRWAG